MQSIKELITGRIEMLEKEQKELKIAGESLETLLTNDSEYVQLLEEVKQAKDRLARCKEALMNEPENRKLAEKIAEIKAELKDLKSLLSSDLLGLFQASGELRFKAESGKVYRMSFKGNAKETEEQDGLFDQEYPGNEKA